MKFAILFTAALAGPAGTQSVPAYPGKPDEHGSVVLVLELDVEGKITDCLIQRPSQIHSLDTAACKIVRGISRLQPATDYNGRPRVSRRYFTVHFVTPQATQTDADLPIEGQNLLIVTYSAARNAQQPNVDGSANLARPAMRLNLNYPSFYPKESLKRRHRGRVSAAITVSPSGKPSGCSVVRSSGFDDLDIGTCKFAMTHLRYEPGTDPARRPISDIDVFTMNYRVE
jgi:TonB family protein